MTNKNQPAFWTPIPSDYAEDGIKEGMSLRDYFAANAMQALVIHQGPNNTSAGDSVDAAVAYRMADAMIAERAK